MTENEKIAREIEKIMATYSNDYIVWRGNFEGWLMGLNS